MAASSYDESLRRLLIHEGGYTNHPADPGGPTNFGVTLADYRKYVKPNATAADVRAMRVDEAKRIYRARYWDAQRCDELPAGVDDTMFDYGVNSGIGRSGKVLRRALGLSDEMGAVTDEVIAALSQRDAKAVIVAINDERLAFLKRLKTWPVFGAGWERRVAEVKAFSLMLAEHAAGMPIPLPEANHASGRAIAPPLLKQKTAVRAGIAATAGAGGVAHLTGAHSTVTAAVFFAGFALLAVLLAVLELRRRAQQNASLPGTTIVPAQH